MTKHCKYCGIRKVSSEFNTNPRMKDGLRTGCRECNNKANKAWRKLNASTVHNTKKFCTGCHTNKTAKEFNQNKSARDGLQSICKLCSTKRAIEYRKTEPEKIRKQDKLSRTRRAHKRSAEFKRWYVANRHNVLTYQAQRYKANAEYFIAQRREYQRNHPEVVRAASHNRRARKKKAKGYTTGKQTQGRIDYYGGLCWICKAPYAVMDHVIALSRGGTNWPANLRPACKACNSSKGSKHPKAFLETRASSRA
jgi:5-methylcytosine-specific restriction endonuclease McrA